MISILPRLVQFRKRREQDWWRKVYVNISIQYLHIGQTRKLLEFVIGIQITNVLSPAGLPMVQRCYVPVCYGPVCFVPVRYDTLGI
jgi:hypothetical protein